VDKFKKKNGDHEPYQDLRQRTEFHPILANQVNARHSQSSCPKKKGDMIKVIKWT
jgi:hypothetical protein